MVMGGDSCFKGCGFESPHRLRDGHFFTCICCKICNDVCLKRSKINNKRPGLAHFLKITSTKKLDHSLFVGAYLHCTATRIGLSREHSPLG